MEEDGLVVSLDSSIVFAVQHLYCPAHSFILHGRTLHQIGFSRIYYPIRSNAKSCTRPKEFVKKDDFPVDDSDEEENVVGKMPPSDESDVDD